MPSAASIPYVAINRSPLSEAAISGHTLPSDLSGSTPPRTISTGGIVYVNTTRSCCSPLWSITNRCFAYHTPRKNDVFTVFRPKFGACIVIGSVVSVANGQPFMDNASWAREPGAASRPPKYPWLVPDLRFSPVQRSSRAKLSDYRRPAEGSAVGSSVLVIQGRRGSLRWHRWSSDGADKPEMQTGCREAQMAALGRPYSGAQEPTDLQTYHRRITA